MSKGNGLSVVSVGSWYRTLNGLQWHYFAARNVLSSCGKQRFEEEMVRETARKNHQAKFCRVCETTEYGF